jgi:hypothetical protein
MISQKIVAELTAKKAELEKSVKFSILDLGETDEIKALRAEAEAAKATGSPQVPSELLQALEAAEKDLEKARELKAAYSALSSTEKRMNELKRRKVMLSELNNEAERFVSLHEQYLEQVANQTEGAVNQCFERVSFRMFDRQVNGALFPTCDIMSKDGRPMETALSTGESLVCGMDIVDTFQRHYDMACPVIVDNAETLTSEIDIDCQVIELRADRDFETLTKIGV